MDIPEPPKIVLEQPAPCADVQSAEQSFRRAVSPSMAPHAGWTVSVRFSRFEGNVAAEGEITDEAGGPVAHRTMNRESADCASLARAVGVWASLVLDAEVARAAAVPKTVPSVDDNKSPPPPSKAPMSAVGVWPAPVINEKPPAEASAILAHPEGERTIELGMTSLIMGGLGTGIVAGPSAFGVIEVGSGWFLRPTVAVARTLDDSGNGGMATWAAGRFDACARVPGMYHDHRGIQLDLCAGAEGGTLRGSGWSLPFAAAGPSIGLRGELAGDLSATLRAVTEINILRESSSTGVAPSLFAGRAEVGLSWRIR